MATRRNRKTRKNYKKSRKNYKRVKRGGLSSNYDKELDFKPRLAESFEGPIEDFTEDLDYKRINRMLNYDKNSKNAQQNQQELEMKKNNLSKLTGLNTFRSLDSEQQKDVAKGFMNLTTVQQYKYIENFKYLGGSKTKKRRRNKKTRGGVKGDCTERALHTELITNPEEYYGQLKDQYCNTFVDENINHKNCCDIIKKNIKNLS